MKNLKTRFPILKLLISLCVLVVSCSSSDPDETEQTPVLSVDENSLNQSSLAGEQYIAVTSNGQWNVSSDASWLTFEPETGSGSGRITVKTTANESFSLRQTLISIKQTGVTTQKVIFKQSAKEGFILPQDEYILPGKKASLEIPIQSNGPYTLSSPAGWVTFDQQASTATKVVLKFQLNTSDKPRSAEVTMALTSGGQREKITITQYGVPDMRIGDNTSVGALAFPGAEGGGRMTTGGRGGTVYVVTNLNDSGPGSLREAVNKTGKRTIVFAVSGTIRLASNLSIRNGDLTIAGQTAPGDGICLRGYELNVGANNVIIRFIRARLGDDNNTEADAMGGRYATNVIIDHCSASWSVDECISFYANTNFTLQWCISSESLRNSAHEKGAHGYGGIWGGKNASFHHNILAHHDSRNPRIQGVGGTESGGVSHMGAIDLRNNVIYNWGGNSAYGGEEQQVNFVNCYYKYGPATSKKTRIYSPDASSINDIKNLDAFGRYYLNGNYVYGSTDATNDNWTYGVWNQLHGSYSVITPAQKSAMKINAPHPFDAVTTHPATAAYEKVLAHAGASLRRDTVDKRLTKEIAAGTTTFSGSVSGTKGIIDKVSDVGGYPVLKSIPALTDTDKDGIPDIWEDAYGLNKNSAADGALYTLDPMGRYTNLEVYLHNLVQHIIKDQNAGGTLTSSH